MENRVKDSKEPRYNGFFRLSGQLGVSPPDYNEVGVLCGPQRRGGHSDENRSGYHRPSDGLPVGRHPKKVSGERDDHRPLVSEEVDECRRHEHTADGQRCVEDARRDHAHSFDLMKAALEAVKSAVGGEAEQEGYADQNDVLHCFFPFSSSFLVVGECSSF